MFAPSDFNAPWYLWKREQSQVWTSESDCWPIVVLSWSTCLCCCLASNYRSRSILSVPKRPLLHRVRDLLVTPRKIFLPYYLKTDRIRKYCVSPLARGPRTLLSKWSAVNLIRWNVARSIWTADQKQSINCFECMSNSYTCFFFISITFISIPRLRFPKN